MPCHIMSGDAAFKVIGALIPSVQEYLRSLIEAASSFELHTLCTQSHDGIVRVHFEMISPPKVCARSDSSTASPGLTNREYAWNPSTATVPEPLPALVARSTHQWIDCAHTGIHEIDAVPRGDRELNEQPRSPR